MVLGFRDRPVIDKLCLCKFRQVSPYIISREKKLNRNLKFHNWSLERVFVVFLLTLCSNSFTTSGASPSSARLRQESSSGPNPNHLTKYSMPLRLVIRFVIIFSTSYDFASSVSPSTCIDGGGGAVLSYGSDADNSISFKRHFPWSSNHAVVPIFRTW